MYEAFTCFVEMHFKINETAQITVDDAVFR